MAKTTGNGKSETKQGFIYEHDWVVCHMIAIKFDIVGLVMFYYVYYYPVISHPTIDII